MPRALHSLPSVSVPETLSGKPGIVDLWWSRHDDLAGFAQMETVLTQDEQERSERFHSERDRGEFLATRLFVRNVLSHYAPVPREEWRFSIGEFGRPRIADGLVDRPIHFNLSHADGIAVCAVSLVHEKVGVDVEVFSRDRDIDLVAGDHFTPQECRVAALILDERDRHRFLLSCWGLKESYLKAQGWGLTLPLHQASFSIEGDRIRATLAPLPEEDVTRWQFELLDLAPDHLIAISTETGGAALSLRTTQVSLFS